METPQVVLDLVDRFECNRDVYRSNQYNETQARHEFIDPLGHEKSLSNARSTRPISRLTNSSTSSTA